MKRLVLRSLLIAGLLLGVQASARADELGTPTGPVVLTIAGNIGTANRGAFDPLHDRFLKYHEKSFAKAAEFDVAMLEALGMKKISFGYKDWPAPEEMEGPLLRDVLAAVGADGKWIMAVALDGYGVEFTDKDLGAQDYVLVLKRNGRYLKLGEYGPALIAFDRDHDAPDKSDAKLIYSTFYIEVQ
jgi:hypothetical protein